MTFDEARAEWVRLNGERGSGRLDENSFRQRVAALRVQDRFGRLWQIAAPGGEWMRWTGSIWTVDSPTPDASTAERPRVGPLCCAKCGAEVTLGRKFCSKCGGPLTENTVYMRTEVGELGVAPPPRPADPQTTQGRSSGRRTASPPPEQTLPRADAVCAFCGTPLRPGKKFCTACGKPVAVTSETTRPPAPAAAPPTVTHRPAASPGTSTRPPAPALADAQPPPVAPPPVAPAPAEHQPVRPWDIVAVAGCSVISGAWFWYSGMADTSPDYLTCASIVALPIAKILLRDKIGRALAPLRSTIGRIPGKMRVGMGLAIPFLVSNQLYAAGASQFPYMLKTTVISAIASFVMLHVPAARRGR